MARGKHSAALFEKIKLDRPIDQQARPGLVRSLSRMFGGAGGGGNGAMRPVMTMASTTTALAPAPSRVDAPAGGGERRSGGGLGGRQRGGDLQFRMSYTGAVIAGFAGVTVVAASFLAGQRMPVTARPSIAAVSVDQLRVQPAQPGVINVRRDVPPPADYTNRNEPATSPNANRPTPPPPPPAQRSRSRQAGLNYVIIQSYPAEEVNMAREAAKLLTENGIECTVEKGLAGYRPNWYSVVGIDGFAKVLNNPQLEAYKKKIRQVSERSAKKGSFKAFSPIETKWTAKSVG